MSANHPRLRPHLQVLRAPDQFVLVDHLGLAKPTALTSFETVLVQALDGKRSLHDLQAEAAPWFGEHATLERVADFVRRLDEGRFLDTPNFRAIADGPVRPPRCIGCYPADPQGIRDQLAALFTHPDGPGLPRPPQPDPAFRAALVPHMDYHRGSVTYAWGFKEVFEKSAASLFVIVGTSHYSRRRFTLTRKHFESPLGVLPTDQTFIDRVVSCYGDGLFDDEWLAHFPEHSIEVEAVFLQYLYAGKRDIRIVPLVVGSFHDCVQTGETPAARDDIGRMIDALRRAEAAMNEPVCWIISGDLAHIGPKFNRGEELTDALLARSHANDQAIIQQAEAANALGYFRAIAHEGDARNICGLPPTYVTLEAIRPQSGKLLHYGRHIAPDRHESVSFASMAFYR